MNKQPRILIWDIETAGVNALNADLGAIVCVGYKWLGEKDAHVIRIDQFPKWFSDKGLNDKPLLKATLDIMEQADILVAHYGDRFDRPFFNGRCAINGLTPPPPTKQRDTCFLAYKQFKFSSNRLQHLADIFRLDEKKYRKSCPDEWPGWWHSALAGNKKAIKAIADYCKQDVLTLEKVYLHLRPYDPAHPRVHQDRSKCGHCGGEINYRGLAYIAHNKYRRFVCIECGHWGRETTKVKD